MKISASMHNMEKENNKRELEFHKMRKIEKALKHKSAKQDVGRVESSAIILKGLREQ